MRYLLFGNHDYYYAMGGIHDLLDSSDSAEELIENVKQGVYTKHGNYDKKIHWWHIYDVKEGKIVTGTESQAHGAPDLEVFE